MSSTVTVRPPKGVRGIGLFSVIVGIVLILAGAGVWVVVSQTLADEKITVSDDAAFLAGDEVDGPFSAYAQADIIGHHALEASGGKTYAQLEQDDPVRETVMDASFLQASLFTSVVAFGVCALVIGLGLMFILFGIAFRRLAGGSEVSVAQSAPPVAATSAPARHSVTESARPAAAPTPTPEPTPEPTPTPVVDEPAAASPARPSAPDAAVPARAAEPEPAAPAEPAAPTEPGPTTSEDDTDRRP